MADNLPTTTAAAAASVEATTPAPDSAISTPAPLDAPKADAAPAAADVKPEESKLTASAAATASATAEPAAAAPEAIDLSKSADAILNTPLPDASAKAPVTHEEIVGRLEALEKQAGITPPSPKVVPPVQLTQDKSIAEANTLAV